MSEEFSESVIGKAEDLVKEDALREDPDREGVWYVAASSGDDEYRVQVVHDREGRVPLASCSCPNGRHKGRPSCKHVAAVLMKIR